eukprot:gene16099-biopygen4148
MDATSKSAPSKSTIRPSNGRSAQNQLRPGATSRENTVRLNSTSVGPMDAPSRSAPSKPSLRPSNGRSVQIGSVQVDAPSVQWTLRSNQLRPNERSVRPWTVDGRSRILGSEKWFGRTGLRLGRTERRLGRTEPRLGRSRFGRSVRWTDGATVWTELIWTEHPSDRRRSNSDGRCFPWT